VGSARESVLEKKSFFAPLFSQKKADEVKGE
jgi:hypothetical protein